MPGFLKIYGYRDAHAPSGWNLSTTRQQLISSLMILGAVLASALSGPIAKYLGRKPCLWTACVLCWAANIIMMADTSIGGLYAGRFIIGLGNGLFMSFSQLYLQEVSPATFRGMALAAFSLWTSVGQLVGTIVDNYTARLEGRESYLIPLGLIYVAPVVIAVGLLVVPESPRWLMEHGKTEKASKALYWLRPNEDAVEPELQSIQAAIDEDRQHKGKALWLEMWRNPIDRRRTILAIAAVNTQVASGSMYMIAYGTYFFEMAGVGKPFENSIILVALGVFAMLVNTCIITHWGRRRVFLITGLILCGLVQLITASIYDAKPKDTAVLKGVVALSIIYVVSFNGFISSYAFLAGGELPSQRMRSYTFGCAIGVSFLGAWLTTFTAPYFINPSSLNWGPRYGYIWAPSCFLAAAWVFWFLPEAKGRTLEEIDEMFAVRLPARKFRTYQCVGPAATTSIEDDDSGEGSQTMNRKGGPKVAESSVKPA
ncbi:hypothetical protein PRZ48_003933 [Zasmidium cellare]|uniref:Major facilitator superfamily (MFS) profile domain-containing protein n=1 Tax=Zasmidium cellare TaxID=395010 RepID=A0ABR0EXQ6_ZASCE|nr:hypothetical protein PRZ48_003933 [Zasmidium cellare]